MTGSAKSSHNHSFVQSPLIWDSLGICHAGKLAVTKGSTSRHIICYFGPEVLQIMANTLMSEGLIGCFDWHHLHQTCKRLNGLSVLCARRKKKEAFHIFIAITHNGLKRHDNSDFTKLLCADFQHSALWKSKLPDISYFPGKWLAIFMFIFILISQIQLMWIHIVKNYLKRISLKSVKYTSNWMLVALFLQVSLTALPVKFSF